METQLYRMKWWWCDCITVKMLNNIVLFTTTGRVTPWSLWARWTTSTRTIGGSITNISTITSRNHALCTRLWWTTQMSIILKIACICLTNTRRKSTSEIIESCRDYHKLRANCSKSTRNSSSEFVQIKRKSHQWIIGNIRRESSSELIIIKIKQSHS